MLGGALELAWRTAGHRPTVVDDKALWAQQRARLERHASDAIVLLGASRVQLGISLDTMRRLFPRHVVGQLAIDGTPPVEVLRDLAADESFRGTVVMGASPAQFERRTWRSAEPFVEYYHQRWRPDDHLDRHIRSGLQTTLVMLRPDLAVPRLVAGLIRAGELPGPSYLETRTDRSRLADYQNLPDLDTHRHHRIERRRRIARSRSPSPPSEWLRDALAVDAMAQRITKRGGEVTFVRFPTTGEHWEIDQTTYPRAQYWDRFAARASAHTIHFRDVPGMRKLKCPDTSHVDRRDAPRLTMLLAEELVRRDAVVPVERAGISDPDG